MFYVVLVCLFVCLSACHQDYLTSNERICMEPEVCIGPRNKHLHCVDDLDYDPYPRSQILFGSPRITIRIAQRWFTVPY